MTQIQIDSNTQRIRFTCFIMWFFHCSRIFICKYAIPETLKTLAQTKNKKYVMHKVCFGFIYKVRCQWVPKSVKRLKHVSNLADGNCIGIEARKCTLSTPKCLKHMLNRTVHFI